jgi:phosphatidylglycerophosphate synthase
MTPQPARSPAPRRRLATRNAAWPRLLARALARAGVRPNAVSIAGVAFAVAGYAAFALAPGLPPPRRAALLIAAAAAIQLRLLCNLLDGMLAVEERLQARTGAIYNDLPDRVADVLLLAGAGYASGDHAYGPPLGWAAALLAVLTAYVRVLGGSLGLTQHFNGPMAKQHRMFTLTVATLVAAGEAFLVQPPRAMTAGLLVIVAGSLVTVARRTRLLLAEAGAR